MTKGWKRLYCTLVPFHFHVGAPATEVQLVMIDETSLSLVDRLWVTNAKGITCPTRARLHIDLVSYLPCCLHSIRASMMMLSKTPASQGQVRREQVSARQAEQQSSRASEQSPPTTCNNNTPSQSCVSNTHLPSYHLCHPQSITSIFNSKASQHLSQAHQCRGDISPYQGRLHVEPSESCASPYV